MRSKGAGSTRIVADFECARLRALSPAGPAPRDTEWPTPPQAAGRKARAGTRTQKKQPTVSPRWQLITGCQVCPQEGRSSPQALFRFTPKKIGFCARHTTKKKRKPPPVEKGGLAVWVEKTPVSSRRSPAFFEAHRQSDPGCSDTLPNARPENAGLLQRLDQSTSSVSRGCSLLNGQPATARTAGPAVKRPSG